MKKIILLICFFIVSVFSLIAQNNEETTCSYKEIKQGVIIDPHIEEKIIKPANVDKIVYISEIKFSHSSISKKTRYHLISIRMSLLGDFSFDKIYHTRFIIRKLFTDPDWSRCEIFYASDKNVYELSCMNANEMRKYLVPYDYISTKKVKTIKKTDIEDEKICSEEATKPIPITISDF